MFETSSTLRGLADLVISRHDELQHIKDDQVRIAYLYSDKEKKSKGRLVYADTEKVSEKIKTLLPYDFIITFYRPNCEMLNDEKMEILMRHELKHVGYDPDKMSCYIVPHDIEDFSDILQEHGLNWTI